MEHQNRRSSISVKMILTSTSLIVGIIGLYSWINLSILAQIYDDQRNLLDNVLVQATRKRGEVQARDLAQATRTPLLLSDYTTLQKLMPDIVRDDPEVTSAYVVDKDGVILAHSDKNKNSGHVTDTVDREMTAVSEPLAKRYTTPGGELYMFAQPIVEGGRRIGTIVLAYTLRVVADQRARLDKEKVEASGRALLRTLAFGLIFILLGTAVAIFQGLRISRPLKMLAWRADQIARGDLDTRVDVSSSDEIGMLGENFNFMADRLLVLMQETAEKATLEKELEVARTIQETLVPTAELVDRQRLKVAGYFLPASQCGGDWWTVHDLADDKVLLVIGDVTGHGVPAAMITAAAKAACDTLRAVTAGKLGVSYLLELLNRAIFESAKRRFVMTCFASIIDTRNRTITYANAGHNFPYLYRSGAAEGHDFQVLMARGNRLGDLEDSTYAEKTQPLEPGDTLIWYTDGVVECENERGEEYGEKRFRAAIRRAANQEPIELRNQVVRGASEFFGERPRKDDITLVFARIYA